MNLKDQISPKTKPYWIGFVLSILCTVFAYLLTYQDPTRQTYYMIIVATLGLLQCFFYFHYFFQIGQSEDRLVNLWMFFLMIIVAVIIILGSIWIMNNLNYYTMPS